MGSESFPKADVDDAMDKAKRFFGVTDESKVDAETARGIQALVLTLCRQKRKLQKIDSRVKPIVNPLSFVISDMTGASPIELVLMNAMARDAVLAGKFSYQFEVGPYKLDFAFPVVKLCVETDGKAYHSSPEQIAHDQSRDGYLARLGWAILRFTYNEVTKAGASTLQKIRTVYLQLYGAQYE